MCDALERVPDHLKAAVRPVLMTMENPHMMACMAQLQETGANPRILLGLKQWIIANCRLCDVCDRQAWN